MKAKHLENQEKPIIYKSKLKEVKGNIIYFHGGGFVFGSNQDLPEYHIEEITGAGYNILSFNYPLAPEADFKVITDYVLDKINSYTRDMDTPYFLWGRSAGGYLSLFAASQDLEKKPNGVISYYGYGLFVPDWHSSPSHYYLKYSSVKYDSVRSLIEEEYLLSAPVNPRFLIYLNSRQTGTWLRTLSNISEEDFLGKFSLKEADFNQFPPVLLAHSTKDNDVPYDESLILSRKIKNSKLLSFNTPDHDFDKNTDSIDTINLIKETIDFLDSNI